MAQMTVNITGDLFYVYKDSENISSCSSVFTYVVLAQDGDDLQLDIFGDALNATYTLNGITSPITVGVPVDVVYDTSLTVKFSLNNGDAPGNYPTGNFNIDNTTTTASKKLYIFNEVRNNDSPSCY